MCGAQRWWSTKRGKASEIDSFCRIRRRTSSILFRRLGSLIYLSFFTLWFLKSLKSGLLAWFLRFFWGWVNVLWWGKSVAVAGDVCFVCSFWGCWISWHVFRLFCSDSRSFGLDSIFCLVFVSPVVMFGDHFFFVCSWRADEDSLSKSFGPFIEIMLWMYATTCMGIMHIHACLFMLSRSCWCNHCVSNSYSEQMQQSSDHSL